MDAKIESGKTMRAPIMQSEYYLAMSTKSQETQESVPSSDPLTSSEPYTIVNEVVGLNRRLRCRTYDTIERSKGLAMPCRNVIEDELDSTASTPPSPVAPSSDHLLAAPRAITNYQAAKITKSNGASRRESSGTSQIRGQNHQIDKPSNSRSKKSSPVKISKHLKVKRRRGSRASSEVWNHFIPQESEEVSSVTKIRNVVRYVRSSPGRSDQFRKCVEKEKISDRSLLSLDVETRWNATYLMLESAVKFEKAFNRLSKENKNFSSHFGEAGLPNAQDWERAREFISVLEPFFKGNDCDWSAMAARMKEKFDKYWGNVAVPNPLLFMAVALDPRFKLKYLEFCAKRIYDQVKAKLFVSTIEGGLTRLFDWYVQAGTNSSHGIRNSTELPLTIDMEEHANPSRLLASQFAIHLQEIESRDSDSELSIFLKDKCEKNAEEFEILTWWKVNSNKYPMLSKLAKYVLAVPVSTVASESAFSTSGRVISSFRSSLSPKMVESAHLCAELVAKLAKRIGYARNNKRS
ncbi:hypothetical protein ACP70R_043134 [Stipagrostis hirtigluma subsp. patula]